MMWDHGDNDCGSHYENVLSTNRGRIILRFSTRSFFAPLQARTTRYNHAALCIFRQYAFFWINQIHDYAILQIAEYNEKPTEDFVTATKSSLYINWIQINLIFFVNCLVVASFVNTKKLNTLGVINCFINSWNYKENKSVCKTNFYYWNELTFFPENWEVLCFSEKQYNFRG